MSETGGAGETLPLAGAVSPPTAPPVSGDGDLSGDFLELSEEFHRHGAFCSCQLRGE